MPWRWAFILEQILKSAKHNQITCHGAGPSFSSKYLGPKHNHLVNQSGSQHIPWRWAFILEKILRVQNAIKQLSNQGHNTYHGAESKTQSPGFPIRVTTHAITLAHAMANSMAMGTFKVPDTHTFVRRCSEVLGWHCY